MSSNAFKIVTGAHTQPRLAPVVAFPRADLDDAELVQRARDGHEWAHEAIYRRYVQRVAQVGRRLLNDPSEVDDVVQETFLIAFETIGKLAQPAALRGWLTRIAVHRVHRRYRWSRLARLWSTTAQVLGSESEISPDVTPEQRAELVRIDQVLQRLPATVRTAWVLRSVLGDALEEVASACGCSLATAKRRIAEAERHIGAHVTGEVTP